MSAAKKPTTLNPNAAKAAVFSANLADAKCYPNFIEQIRFENFRHLDSLVIPFIHPVTVISGANKSGKTTVLLAIACSHFEFKKRNYTNGKLERQTWSDVMKLSSHDVQKNDWTYFLKIKSGAKREERRGQRKSATKKWNGLGKKESQIHSVNVVYLDLDRIMPARYFSNALHRKAQVGTGIAISTANQAFIEMCFSYVMEQSYKLTKLADHQGRNVLGFTGKHDYSSFNSASGEDVVSRILIDCIEAPPKSLILIDELELGLHPKVQRRLMDILFAVSNLDNKQFIVTSHSATVLATVPNAARVFVDDDTGVNRGVTPISINAVLSKMDSVAYPLVDVFCEDNVAHRIVAHAIREVELRKLPGVSSRLFNMVSVGAADETYMTFKCREKTYPNLQISSGYACVLDGDMRNQKDSKNLLRFPPQEGLAFLPGTVAPERALCDAYEKANPNTKFRYHIDNSNAHCLLGRMKDLYGFADDEQVFAAAWKEFIAVPTISLEFEGLVDFLIAECRRYSPAL